MSSISPDLYIPNEIAQAKPLSRASSTIPLGPDMMIPVSKTLYEVMHDNVDYYYKDGDDYKLFDRPTVLYRKNPTSLFAGLDANYTTAQESNSSLDYKLWEANVHKETNNGKTYWVPLKGYRAEIINTRLSSGSFFPYALPNEKVTGYIFNSFENGTSVKNTPSIPEY